MDVVAGRSFFARGVATAYHVAMFSYELTCRNCGWRTVCGAADAAARLRVIGLLRRETNPDEATVAELFEESAPRMTCPICKEKRLVAKPSAVAEDGGDDWQTAELCEVCREPIPPERLHAIPGAKRCAACQGKTEAGRLDADEPDYCPHCGSLVEVRVSRGGGIARYKRFCTGDPPCRL
jgi:Zn finger protein HypA/HybF involved in hydrogenase expression